MKKLIVLVLLIAVLGGCSTLPPPWKSEDPVVRVVGTGILVFAVGITGFVAGNWVYYAATADPITKEMVENLK